METGEIKVVKLRTDDGIEQDLPLELLVHFPSLFAMVTDIGYLQEDSVLPISNGSGTSTAKELEWVVDFYTELYLPLYAPTDARYDTLDIKRPELDVMPLISLLKLEQFTHYNDCKEAHEVILRYLQERLTKGDAEVVNKATDLIAIEDVYLWSRQRLLAEYLLRVMAYARRYRQNLTFLRGVAHLFSPVLVQFLVRPTLEPLVCGRSSTMIITPDGLFATGYNKYRALGLGETLGEYVRGGFQRVGIEGEFISLSLGLTESMLVTTEGLFSSGTKGGDPLRQRPFFEKEPLHGEQPLSVCCGEWCVFVITTRGTLFSRGDNAHGRLGLDSDSLFVEDFTPVEIIGTALSVACFSNSILLITTSGLFATGFNQYGQLGLGDLLSRSKFEKVTIPGRPLSVAQGADHAVVLTTEGLFTCGGNYHGQLGTGSFMNPFKRATFVRVKTEGEPLAVACGSYHTMLITTEGLFGCGNGQSGRLGMRVTQDTVETFLKVFTVGTPISVACGENFTMLLTTEGLFASGSNEREQLGLIGVFYTPIFTLVRVSGLPVRALQEEPDKKRQRMGCRLCGTTAGLRKERLRPDRVFCSELCHRKCHYFDQILGHLQ